MRTILFAAAALLAVAGPAAAAARGSPEAQLERAVQGHVAGEPVSCLDTRRFTSARIIDRTAIVYEAPGGTLWVNRPRGGARSLDDWDVLVTRQYSGSLCRGDIVRLFDPTTMTQTGTIFLGDFVPYRRAN
jgi:hypothetical protein